MNKLLKGFFWLLALAVILIASIVAISQTSWFREKLEKQLHEFAKESGFSLSIGDLKGSIPLKWNICNLSLISSEGTTILVDTLQFRIAFFPLLRQEIGISYFKAGKVSVALAGETENGSTLLTKQAVFEGLNAFPINVSIHSFKIQELLWKEKELTLPPLVIQGTAKIKKEARNLLVKLIVRDKEKNFEQSLLFLGGKKRGFLEVSLKTRILQIKKGAERTPAGSLLFQGIIGEDGTMTSGSYALEIPSLSVLSPLIKKPLEGSLKANASLNQKKLTGMLSVEKMRFAGLHFASIDSKIDIDRDEDIWQGSIKLEATEEGVHFTGGALLHYARKEPLTLTNLELKGPSFHMGGDLSFDLQDYLWQGTLRLQDEDLSALDPLFPEKQLEGLLGVELQLDNNAGQSLRIHAKSSKFQMRNLQVEDATLFADVHFIENDPVGNLELHAERIYLPDIYIASCDLLSTSDEKGWNYSFEAKGTWKEPFHIKTEGNYLEKCLTIHTLDGKFLDHAIKLEDPSKISFSKKNLNIESTSLLLGTGRLSGKFHALNEEWQLTLQGNEVPLAWLTLFTPYVSLQGQSNIVCALHGNQDKIQGSCQLALKDLQAKRFGTQPLFQAKGSLLAHFEDKKVQLHTELCASDGQIVLVDATIPLIPAMPLHIDFDAPWSGSLLVVGKLEELSDFFNTGFHRWKGWVEGKILFSRSLRQPLMQGDLAIHQGSYENDLIGLYLENLEACLRASHNEFLLTSLEATGPKGKGNIKATGHLSLLPDDDFPYRLSAHIDKLKTINLDLASATLTGPVEIEGTSKQAIARGTLEIDEADFSIPRSLPADLPDLPITYLNKPSHVELSSTLAQPTFPFRFDVNFTSKDTITFDTGGLHSVWGGEFHLHGVNFNLLTRGTLRLARGQFTLLGKTFQLNQGEISFTDLPGQEGLLNLSGTLNMSDVTITATLRGSLTSPQLSLHSVPPISTSDIFSLILFNKRMNEIKPVQAIQLAHTAMSLSGNAGWNFVGQIGSGLNVLGIDTFDIIPSEKGFDQTSITIGKYFYLVRGVLISLTQSLTSSRFTVDVDLGGGVLFQAENISGENQAEQVGKFSFKWNKNY